MPPPVSAGTPRTQETARAQRVSQPQYIEERFRYGIPPVAVAGVAAFISWKLCRACRVHLLTL